MYWNELVVWVLVDYEFYYCAKYRKKKYYY
jgi:hypothetical protein